MRLFIATLFILLASAPALFAQNPAIRDFIREHRKGKENVAFTVPGWMIGLAGDIGVLASDDEDERAVFALAREFGTVRLLTFNDEDFNTRADINALLKAIETHHGYERWASMRGQHGEVVQLSVLQKERRKQKEIQEIVAIVTEPEEGQTFFAHFKTDLTAEELGDVLNRIMAE